MVLYSTAVLVLCMYEKGLGGRLAPNYRRYGIHAGTTLKIIHIVEELHPQLGDGLFIL